MTISTKQQTLGGLVLFSSQLEIWSGTVSYNVKRYLSADVTSELPPDELATNGRLHLIPPRGHLSKLSSVRKGVERLLKEFGIPLLGGVAIPEAKVNHVMAELATLEKTFDDRVDDLVSELPQLYAAQIEAHPKWAQTLQVNQLGAQRVRERCRFDVAVYEVADPVSKAATARLKRAAGSAFPTLLEDIANKADEIFTESFLGKSQVTQKAVNPVRRLVDKLETFSFIDPRVLPMVTNLRATLASIPKQGPLQPSEITAVVTMLNSIASPERLLQFGAGSIQLANAPAQAPLLIETAPELDAASSDATPEPAPVISPTAVPAPSYCASF